VRDYALPKTADVLEDVMDQPAKECDVAAGTYGHVHGCVGAGPRKPRIDMDDRRAPELRLHYPLEANRMVLGHVRAHDQDAVRVRQVLLEVGGAAPTEARPQTGDCRAVSYAGLVLDLDHAEREEQLLDQVVLLVVEGGSAKGGDPHRAVERASLRVTVLPALRARLDDAIGDHVQGAVECQVFPI